MLDKTTGRRKKNPEQKLALSCSGFCLRCKTPLTRGTRGPARKFCSDRCRTAHKREAAQKLAAALLRFSLCGEGLYVVAVAKLRGSEKAPAIFLFPTIYAFWHVVIFPIAN